MRHCRARSPHYRNLVRIGFARHRIGQVQERRPDGSGALRPENRVTARSKLPQKKCTGLALPRNLCGSAGTHHCEASSTRQKRWSANRGHRHHA